jgi:hypothetical protein
MWFLHIKFILIKDNLIKRNWQCETTCVFCEKEESIQHLFFECHMAKLIWRLIHLTLLAALFILTPDCFS